MSRRLYYDDSYLAEFAATVVETSADRRRVYLDRTAFYPASGGQPCDAGTIGGVPVVDVIDEGDRIAHLTAEAVEAAELECRIEWTRRFDHMQQHSGQHVLSAVLLELFDCPTLSFHLGRETSTIDIAAPSLDARQVLGAERRANELVFENHRVSVAYHEPGDAVELRKPSEREGTLRVVVIEGLDRSACGGTHVRATGEIGPILLGKLDRVRGNARLEFLCGYRALARARSDFDSLSEIARVFSAPPGETPALVNAQRERLLEAEKRSRRLAAELAGLRGRELYHATPEEAGGRRVHWRRIAAGSIDDELRAEAGGFTSLPGAVFVAVLEAGFAVLLACSEDAGVPAGDVLKMALSAAGGRGGGNARLAQGSLPARDALEETVAELTRRIAGR